jgi:nicotinamide mononucleotide transporter
MSLIEIFATFFGFLCVWLTIKRNIWCWPAGIIQVSLFIFIFYDTRLYSDMLLHIIYVFLNSYGWYHWYNSTSDSKELKVTDLRTHLWIWVIGCIAGTLGLAFVMSTYTNASMPYPDSFITAASLIAQWLMAKKKLESWYFWLIADVMAMVVYWNKELYLTTGLYIAFLIMATLGFWEWRKTFLQSKLFPTIT